jgi:RNA polymerase sigma factor (sigma-70 family)
MHVTAEEQKLLVKQAQKGCKKSLDKLIICNIAFYRLLAKKYSRFMPSGFEEDLLQEGLTALVERILPKYDENKGANWLTYSSVSISRYMLTYKTNNYFAIDGVVTTRIGRRLFWLTRKTKNIDELLKLMQEKGYTVTKDFVENFLAIASVRNGMCYEQESPVIKEVELQIYDPLLKKRVMKILSKMSLSDREKIILENLVTERYTNEELGKKFECSRQRVHQIEVTLKDRLRKALVT